jgi:MFS family permease
MTALRELLGRRRFAAVWSASLVSGLGDKIALIALYLLVYRLAGRAVDLGLLAAVQILPAILLGPVSGLLLDRWDRRKAMVGCELASALVVAAIPLSRTLPQVYLLAALLSAARQISGPARLAIVPAIVPEPHLARANALLMITHNVVLLVGPAAGGAIVALWGTRAAFWVDAGTFVVSAGLLAVGLIGREMAGRAAGAGEGPAAAPAAGLGDAPSTVAVPGIESPGAQAPAGPLVQALRDIRQGAAWLWGQPHLRFAFAFLGAMAFVTAMQQPLIVVFVKEVLGRGAVDLGLILSAAGLGGIAGALGSGLLSRLRRPLRNVTWLVAIDGLALVLFAVNRSFAGALLLFGLFGALGSVVQINLATFLQRETPDRWRGRVFGWLGTLLGPLSLLSVCLGPLLADAIGVVVVLALSGLFELAAGLAGRATLPARRDESPAGVSGPTPRAVPAAGPEEAR